MEVRSDGFIYFVKWHNLNSSKMITKETNHRLLSFKIDVPGYFL